MEPHPPRIIIIIYTLVLPYKAVHAILKKVHHTS